jgi:hypothetical protein
MVVLKQILLVSAIRPNTKSIERPTSIDYINPNKQNTTSIYPNKQNTTCGAYTKKQMARPESLSETKRHSGSKHAPHLRAVQSKSSSSRSSSTSPLRPSSAPLAASERSRSPGSSSPKLEISSGVSLLRAIQY